MPDAVARGAVAALSDEPVPGLCTIVAADARHALASVAAELQGHPARRLCLVGITGTLGKTSTSLLLESAIAAGGTSVGAIGSLGVRRGPPRRGAPVHTARMTTPDAPALHAALRRLADERVNTVVMEITSHGILQERVAGLELAAGLFTNLVPDEHLEYHPTAEHYVSTKLRFLDLLAPDAPLVVDASNHRVLADVRGRAGVPPVTIALDGAADAAVRLATVRHHLNGASFVLTSLASSLARAASGSRPATCRSICCSWAGTSSPTPPWPRSPRCCSACRPRPWPAHSTRRRRCAAGWRWCGRAGRS